MWDGPGQGPRGRPPFRGNHDGDMFGGRDHPMSDFRGRDGMNMRPTGPMGPLDPPRMDMRRMDGPPMWDRDMNPHDMRGRTTDRDFFRSGPGPDLNFQGGQFDRNPKDNLMHSPGFSGHDMGGRNMPNWPKNNRPTDMRDRDMFRNDTPHFNNPNNPNVDGGRGFPVDRMKDDDFRRTSAGIIDNTRYNLDAPSIARRRMENDRRGGPPLNSRGGFQSDMDFRNHPGPPPQPPSEFPGRERSPLRFGNDASSTDRARTGMPVDVSGPQRPEFKGPEVQPRMRKGPNSCGSPLMDYRSGEEMTLAEEWKSRQKDQPQFPDKGAKGDSQTSLAGFRRDAVYQDANRPPMDFLGKDLHFQRGDQFAEIDRLQIGRNSPQNRTTLPGNPVRGNESKHWLAERGSDQSHNKSKLGEGYHNKMPSHGLLDPKDSFKGLADMPFVERQTTSKMAELGNFQSGDQDYRDIDYRTASGRMFEFKQADLQVTPLIQDSKPTVAPDFSASGSKDQDYRKATVADKVSSTLSIIGIPKSATMEQILGAFTVQDGLPQPGMKIKNVVPGYSYDTAYVEFLNLEDAVRFMESNKGSLKVGTRTISISYSHPDNSDTTAHDSHHTLPPPKESQLSRPDHPSEEFLSNRNGATPKDSTELLPPNQWQRNSDLTPEAWQQQMDQQYQHQESEMQAESWGYQHSPPHNSHQSKSVFKDSKTMILKNILPTTTVGSILKALDPYAYLDERNIRLIKAKTPGAKCFCFIDMDSHEQVTRLVDLLLTRPAPLCIDGFRVYAQVAKPLKNQRREFDRSNNSSPGYRTASSMESQQFYPQTPPSIEPPPGMQGLPTNESNPAPLADANISHGSDYDASQAEGASYQATGAPVATDATTAADDAEAPDTSSYLYDATSGFYYDPDTTLYYDPGSRYFYNAQNQEYLYWDVATKAYLPVPGGNQGNQPIMTAEDQAILSNPAADAPLDMKRPSAPPMPITQLSDSADNLETLSPEKKDDDDSAKRDDRPRSIAAVKIMKDMERWAKIQNRQKDCVRSPSPVLKGSLDDDKKQSKSADAGFAVFERKKSGEEFFKKPLAPLKKEEKSKRPMGSLGMLASEYAAGSDEEVEEDKEDTARGSQVTKAPPLERGDKLTDWKKMACLLCRRQFPNKDALIRHQQLSDLHKQNMEIHLKIKKSKKELEALESQEKKLTPKEVGKSPEQKRRKQQQQHHSREINKAAERPGLGSEPPSRRPKKDHVAWDHATYKQAVRKAMFARFKELD
ncbi:RNA-binding protein 10 isoform X2 [Stigmatopora nigra]